MKNALNFYSIPPKNWEIGNEKVEIEFAGHPVENVFPFSPLLYIL